MSAQPAEPQPGDLIRPDDQVIRVGDRKAVVVEVVEVDELRRLRATEKHAPAGAIEEAEIEADTAAHKAWAAAGRPGAEPHEKVKAELLAELGL